MIQNNKYFFLDKPKYRIEKYQIIPYQEEFCTRSDMNTYIRFIQDIIENLTKSITLIQICNTDHFNNVYLR